MTGTARSSLVRTVARFDEASRSNFLIDNVKLSFSPNNLGVRGRIVRSQPLLNPEDIINTTELGLRDPADVSLVHRGNEFVLAWKWGSDSLKQGLGAFRRGETATLTIDTNPTKAVRKALSRPERLRHDRVPNNYLDPRVLPAKTAHLRCLNALDVAVREGREDYRRIVGALFGQALTESDVLVSVNMIELAWDVLVPFHAQLLPTFFAKSWKRCLSDGRRVFRPTETSEGGDGVLKAQDDRGFIFKLYAKTADVARFEVQLPGDRARELTGARLNPGDRDAFAKVLGAIAAQVYPSILAVQEESETPPVVSVQEVFPLLSRDSSDRYIIAALLDGHRVKCRGQRDYRRLVQLRDDGIVIRGPGKGWWSATREFAEVAEVIRIAQTIADRRAS